MGGMLGGAWAGVSAKPSRPLGGWRADAQKVFTAKGKFVSDRLDRASSFEAASPANGLVETVVGLPAQAKAYTKHRLRCNLPLKESIISRFRPPILQDSVKMPFKTNIETDRGVFLVVFCLFLFILAL